MFRSDKGGGISYTVKPIPDDFELRFQWKVGPNSNSGVYYRPGQYEYQILDNVHSPYGENARQAAASLFFCMAPRRDATKAQVLGGSSLGDGAMDALEQLRKSGWRGTRR